MLLSLHHEPNLFSPSLSFPTCNTSDSHLGLRGGLGSYEPILQSQATYNPGLLFTSHVPSGKLRLPGDSWESLPPRVVGGCK